MPPKAAHGDPSPESDVYWHTREACFELTRRARENGSTLCFTWGSVLQCVKDLVFTEERDLQALAGDLWESTMHPQVLVDAVHNH